MGACSEALVVEVVGGRVEGLVFLAFGTEAEKGAWFLLKEVAEILSNGYGQVVSAVSSEVLTGYISDVLRFCLVVDHRRIEPLYTNVSCAVVRFCSALAHMVDLTHYLFKDTLVITPYRSLEKTLTTSKPTEGSIKTPFHR